MTSPKQSHAPIQPPSSSQRATRSAKARVSEARAAASREVYSNEGCAGGASTQARPASITAARLVVARLGDARGAERAAQHLDPCVDQRVLEADRERAAERLASTRTRVRARRATAARGSPRASARSQRWPASCPTSNGGIAQMRDLGVEQLRPARRDEHVRRLHVGVDERAARSRGSARRRRRSAAPARAPKRAHPRGARSAGESGKSFGSERQREDVLAVQAAHLLVVEAAASAGSRVPACTAPRKPPSTAAARRRVAAARQPGVERLGAAEVLEHERHALRIEVVHARADAVPVEARHASRTSAPRTRCAGSRPGTRGISRAPAGPA